MNHPVITISRQFGSGGHEVAERLAKETQMKLYDDGRIQALLRDRNADVSNYPYEPLPSFGNGTDSCEDPEAEANLIAALAQEGPCIFVGRCADYVLRDYDNLISVFIYAPDESRLHRVKKRFHLSEEEAIRLIRQVDQSRSDYYSKTTHDTWGSREHYRAVLNSAGFGLQGCVNVIKSFLPGSTR